MLNPREELQLHGAREGHTWFAIGYLVAFTIAALCCLFARVADAPGFYVVALLECTVGVLFLLCAQRPLRRIRELERFR